MSLDHILELAVKYKILTNEQVLVISTHMAELGYNYVDHQYDFKKGHTHIQYELIDTGSENNSKR